MAAAGVAVLSLAACSGFQYDNAKNEAPASGAFEQALQKGYLELSQSEYKEGDYIDSDVFARRSMAAAAGSPPQPEALAARDLPKDKVDELSTARNRLMTALQSDAARKNPDAAAEAQVMFDCWMQEQEENFQPKCIEKCRDGFEAAMAKLEEKPRPAAVMSSPDRYLVFFDFDKANLTPKAEQTIGEAAANAGQDNVSGIRVIGHADRAGPAPYNVKLSERRAENVKQSLAQQGYQGRIGTEARGESDPLVPTKDGVAEPQNRRAEILFGKPGS
jgi:outer membrane protein OmpA-like peptidoglycan-associated protein